MKPLLRAIVRMAVRHDWIWKRMEATLMKLAVHCQDQRDLHESSPRPVPFDLGDEIAVAHGPFQGMSYLDPGTIPYAAFPKLLGCYEWELWSTVEKFCQCQYAKVINIGGAEGYYANGFAYRFPNTPVHAFDTNIELHPLCQQLAELNGVADRVHISSECTPETLVNLCHGQRVLIASDCEGYEHSLFTEKTIPSLKDCDLIIETHDFVDIRISIDLERLFEPTHSILTISSVPEIQKAKRCNFPELEGLDLHGRVEALSDAREHAQEWLVLQSRNQTSSHVDRNDT